MSDFIGYFARQRWAADRLKYGWSLRSGWFEGNHYTHVVREAGAQSKSLNLRSFHDDEAARLLDVLRNANLFQSDDAIGVCN